MPEINPFYALCFRLSGMFMTGGMTITPLTWSELDAFVSRSSYHLTGFEAENIIQMSREYCGFSTKAKDLGCPPPYGSIVKDDPEALQAMRDRVAAQWAKFETGFSKKKA